MLEKNYADYTVVTSWPILHMLVEPRYGYVDEAFKVISSERKVLNWKGVKLWSTQNAGRLDRSRVCWVSYDSAFFRRTTFNPAEDTLLEKVEYNNRVAWIYQKKL